MTARDATTPTPVLVRQVDFVAGSDGAVHPVQRPVAALCRCDCSALAPWCDSSHKMLRRRRGRRTAGEASTATTATTTDPEHPEERVDDE